MLFGVKYSQALWLYILHNGPLMPLAHVHARDSFGAVATSTAGAPTKAPIQGCLRVHMHLYLSFQRPDIDAYLLH